jgi:hypothetical protein
MTEDDRLQAQLEALPVRDVRPDVGARALRRAQAHLAMERARGASPWMGSALFFVTLWSRVGMPIALASVVGVYLTWAFRFAGALYR